MKHLRSHLTYANVMVTLLAVVVLGGGAAYAASQLPKNSVGPKQLRKNAVRTKAIRKKAVTGAKVKPNSLGGAQIDESRLGTVPSALLAASADRASDAATLAGKPPAAFLAADRLAFGTGNATDTTPTRLFDLPGLGITVTTDGDADTTPSVLVNLPEGSYWYVFEEDKGTQLYSIPDGGVALELTAPPEVANVRSSYLGALIWRTNPDEGMYLRCVFDTHGFSSLRPLACWALRV